MSGNLILFDFDETIVSSSGPTKIIKNVLEDFIEYKKYPANDVFILTARYQKLPVIEFFEKLGINNVDVVAVGELHPLAKSAFVFNQLSKKNYQSVKVYEDKLENIKEIEKVVNSHNISFSYVLVEKQSIAHDIRDFINLTLNKGQDMAKSPGAGIVVVRKFDNKWKVLGLKLGGSYDLPKGKMEKGETAFQAASRETKEETGIEDLDFMWGDKSTSIKHLTFFVAQTTQDAHIPQNPESGIYEHDSAEWLSFKKMKSNAYGFLVPVVKWAESIVIN